MHEVGAVIELPEADAAQYVQSGVIKEKEGGDGGGNGDVPTPPAPPAPAGGDAGQATPETPQTPPAGETPAPAAPGGEAPAPAEEPAPAQASAEKPKGWVGGHHVGGNEPEQPLRTPHPAMQAPAAA